MLLRMPTSDLIIVFRWWLTVSVLGWAVWPVIRILFSNWKNEGYLLAKGAGVALVALVIYIASSLKIAPFEPITIALIALLIFLVGNFALNKRKEKSEWSLLGIITEEVFFGILLLAWTWVRSHEPSINGLEKFMDFGFTQSILNSKYFPAADMWFAPLPINYYYFGHLCMATLTKLSGLDLFYTFNLMLATIFAWCFSMSFAIGRQLLGNTKKFTIAGALLIAFLVTLAGNLQTIYVYTKGYTGKEDNPPPFWQIMINPFNPELRKAGEMSYWYPNATRFIPYTIHEFPGYSFVVSDVHGHVLSIPLALLAISLLINMYGSGKKKLGKSEYIAYGIVSGMAFMTNALDGPIYMGLFCLLQLVRNLEELRFKVQSVLEKDNILTLVKQIGLTVVTFGLTILPFLIPFKSFVSGVGVNCPPAFLANSKIGPFLFEGVEKCQKSPIWMMLILWGFFLYGGIWYARKMKSDTQYRLLFLTMSIFCLGLIIFPEFFYVKDIYPQHFRSNTMFKLGYQVFMMMSIITGCMIVNGIRNIKANKWWLLGIVPLLYLVSIYPLYSVKSYFGKLDVENYKSIYGMQWLIDRHPGDMAAISWFRKNVPGQTVVLEANGDSYTDYERISTFTGLPTVAGWVVHEWLWRGGYEPIAARAEEVKEVYETDDLTKAKDVLNKYKVKYIVLGDLERQKYPKLNEGSLNVLGRIVFEDEGTKIFEVI